MADFRRPLGIVFLIPRPIQPNNLFFSDLWLFMDVIEPPTYCHSFEGLTVTLLVKLVWCQVLHWNTWALAESDKSSKGAQHQTLHDYWFGYRDMLCWAYHVVEKSCLHDFCGCWYCSSVMVVKIAQFSPDYGKRELWGHNVGCGGIGVEAWGTYVGQFVTLSCRPFSCLQFLRGVLWVLLCSCTSRSECLNNPCGYHNREWGLFVAIVHGMCVFVH